VLKSKVEGYYVQDYADFFDNLKVVEFEMSAAEQSGYELAKKRAIGDFVHPVKLYSDVSEAINLVDSRYAATKKLAESLLTGIFDDGKKIAIVNNSAAYTPRHRKKLGNFDFLTFRDDPKKFEAYDAVIFMQLPVIQPYNLFYILCGRQKFFQLHMTNNNLEKYFFEKIYNHELRRQFDRFFYHADVR
jgi:hypothetical protein